MINYRFGGNLEPGYDTAQVCLNGHVKNLATRNFPQRSQKHCDECGAETITACPKCQAPLRGMYYGEISYPPESVPAFCYSCGGEYPWTTSKLQAARDIIDLTDDIPEKDKEELLRNLDDLLKDVPQTQVEALRMKKFLLRIGKDAATGLRNILVDIASETAKKVLWPS